MLYSYTFTSIRSLLFASQLSKLEEEKCQTEALMTHVCPQKCYFGFTLVEILKSQLTGVLTYKKILYFNKVSKHILNVQVRCINKM